MIRTAEPGEDWWWCYADDRLYEDGSNAGGRARTHGRAIASAPDRTDEP